MNIYIPNSLKTYRFMILIWLDEIGEEGLRTFLSLIENWEGFEFIVEHNNNYYECKVGEEDSIAEELRENLVLKILIETGRTRIKCKKMKFRNKRSLIRRFKESNAVLFLMHE